MDRILIILSKVHDELSKIQRDKCVELVEQSGYLYALHELDAGTYEIPFVIDSYGREKLFDGYIALGLVLKNNSDHFDFVMSHIKACFTHFALQGIIVGNGIVTGSSLDELAMKISSDDPCLSAYASAFKAVDALIKFKKDMAHR